MTPILIGHFAKQTASRLEWLRSEGVEEICSVSDCISKAPDGWIEHWRHNDFWCFDTQELAWSVVPADKRSDYELYAYQLFPICFDGGEQVPLELHVPTVEPLPSTFTRLGFDAVNRQNCPTFECSPLSCNGMATERKVNRHCLVDSQDEGFAMAVDFSRSQPEPGCYYLLEVWRASNTNEGYKRL